MKRAHTCQITYALAFALILVFGLIDLASASRFDSPKWRKPPKRINCNNLLQGPFTEEDLSGFPGVYPNREQVSFPVMAKGIFAATPTMQRVNETLRFDIDITPKARGKGLYAKIMSRVLEANPDIRFMPAQMPLARSDNAEAFAGLVFRTEDPERIRHEFHMLNQWDLLDEKFPETVVDFRRRTVSAYYGSPMAKARVANGFGKLSRFVWNSDRHCIEFVAERGEVSLADEVPIYFLQRSGQVTRLMSDGTTRLAEREEISMGDYPKPIKECS